MDIERIILAANGIVYTAQILDKVSTLTDTTSNDKIMKERSSQIKMLLENCKLNLHKELEKLCDYMNATDCLCDETVDVLDPILKALQGKYE